MPLIVAFRRLKGPDRIAIKKLFALLQSFIIVLDALKFIARRQKIFVHDLIEAIANQLHCLGAEATSRLVFVNDVMRGLGPYVI